jgi:hypothetical protein
MNHYKVQEHATECVRLLDIKSALCRAINNESISSEEAKGELWKMALYYEQELFKEEQKLKHWLND